MTSVPDCSPAIAAIRALVAADAHLDVPTLVSRGRTRPIAHARQLGVALCRELTGALIGDIGNAFGLGDHSAANWAVHAVNDRRATEPAYARKWDNLLAQATTAVAALSVPEAAACAVRLASIILAQLATGDLVSVRIRLAAKASGLGLHAVVNTSSHGRAGDRAALIDGIITLSAAIARAQAA